jgi:hypothetical protein
MRFDDFDLNDTLLDAVYYMNYTEATEPAPAKPPPSCCRSSTTCLRPTEQG